MTQSDVSHLLIASVVGGLFVTSVMPFNILMLIAWLAVVGSIAARPNGPHSHRIRHLVTQLVAFSTVTLVAYVAPVKLEHDRLSKRVRLPSPDLTIADIEVIEGDDFPVHTFVTCDDRTLTETIRFTSTDVSLGEFIAMIEKQTPLRHRFVHCGNAYSILWGYPPSYVLMLIEETDRTESTPLKGDTADLR